MKKTFTRIVEVDNKRYYLYPDFLKCLSQDMAFEKLSEYFIEGDEIPFNNDFFSFIGFTLTDECNTKCKYCFRECSAQKQIKKEIQFNEFETLVKFFRKKLTEKNQNFKAIIHLSGGEIFVKPELEKYLECILKNGFKLALNTNGISPEIRSSRYKKFLSDKNTIIRVSLDGHTSEIHEKYRQKGTFNKTVENIKYLTEINNNIQIKSVLSQTNSLYLEDFLEFLHGINVNYFTYNIIKKVGYAKDFTDNEIISESNIAKKLVKILEKKEHLAQLVSITRFCEFLNLMYNENPQLNLGTPYRINHDGNVYPGDLASQEFLLGNIYEGTSLFLNGKIEDFKEKHDLYKKTCLSCDANRFCTKGRHDELFETDSSLEAEFPNCDDLRELFYYCLTLGQQGVDLLSLMRYH